MADERIIFDLLTGQNKIKSDLAGAKASVAQVEKSVLGLRGSFATLGKSIGGIGSALRSAQGIAIGFAAVFAGAKVIRAAEEQEDAINRLNAALKVNGDTSAETSKELQEYASNLQKVTKIGDELTLSNLALLQSIAPLTKEGLIAANNAAADLSAALRIDLQSAIRLVGRAAIGDVELFKRYGIEVRKGANDAETFANALKAVNSRTGGAAANELNTYSGATAQLSNAFGDALEEIGLIIIQTPQLISIIKSSAESFASLAENVKEFAPEARKFIGSFIDNIGSVTRFAAEFAIVGAAIFRGFGLATSAIQLFRINLEILQARNGVGVFTAISREALIAAGSMKALQIATIATRVAITALKAVATLGATLALDAAITSLLELREEFGSLQGAIQALWIKFKKLGLEAIIDVASRLGGLFEAASSVPGSPEFLKNISDGLKTFNNNAKESVKNLSKELDNIKSVSVAAENQVGRSTASISKNLLKTSNGLDELARKNLETSFITIQKELKNAGLTSFEQISKEAAERSRTILDAKKLNLISVREAANLQEKVGLDAVGKINEAQKKFDQERQKDLFENIQIAADNPFNLVFKNLDPTDISKDLASGIAGGAGALNSILGGAKGAAELISGAAGAAGNAIIPGIGAALEPIVQALSGGPEAVKQLITEFVSAVPTIVENILLAIPQVFITLFESLGPLVEKLFEVIPAAVEAFISRLPEIIQALIQGALRASATLAARMPFIATELATSLIAEAPNIAVSVIDAFIEEAPRFITELIKQIPKAAGGAIGGIGSAGGDIFGSVGDALGGIGDIFGFAEGGTVVGGAPFIDRIPSVLTPGETVVDRELTNKLDNFLSNNGGNGAPQNLTINLQIGEQNLANVLVDLTSRGFKLA